MIATILCAIFCTHNTLSAHMTALIPAYLTITAFPHYHCRHKRLHRLPFRNIQLDRCVCVVACVAHVVRACDARESHQQALILSVTMHIHLHFRGYIRGK